MKCPRCDSDLFDGWDCKDCGHAIPEKLRKTHGKLLSPEEAEKVRKILFPDLADWPIYKLRPSSRFFYGYNIKNINTAKKVIMQNVV